MTTKAKIILLFSLILIVAVVASLIVFWGNKRSDTNSNNDVVDGNGIQQATDSLGNIMSDLKKQGEEVPQFLLDLESKSRFSIVSFSEEGETAIAEVIVYAPDIYSIAKKIDETHKDKRESELSELICQELSNAEIVEKTVELSFKKVNNKYEPIITSEFLDAYYGGVFRLYDDLLNTQQ